MPVETDPCRSPTLTGKKKHLTYNRRTRHIDPYWTNNYFSIKKLCHEYRTFTILKQKIIRLQYQMLYVGLKISICNAFY